ncbi:MucR family transcriptional regulator [Novosphingobium terrae]|uniref:MucR family transcriptional regulator n=1 Tax=Novosphingobium terrae TaxID=2726189 RepID=UPI001981EBF1|nr:MucR family transcriptional regulator [Novosphingobium terrae]
MTDKTLLTLAADIVSSHVGHNNVAIEELPRLIQSVYASLENLGKEPEGVAEKREPAVSIRASVKPDALTCLECGMKMKMLKRHLSADHDLTPADYRTRWNLNSDYPMVAPEYAAKRAELAKKIGLGRKPKAALPTEPAPAALKRGRKKIAAADAA